MKQPVIAIVGAGAVGSTTAYALIVSGIAAKILLIDVNEARCHGEIQDLTDALSADGISSIGSGTMEQAGQADIIILAAGNPQKPDQTRLALLANNYAVFASLIQNLKPIKSTAIIIVVTNPVDILTRYVQEQVNLPRTQIFGSGTFLDSHRLHALIAERLRIDQRSVHAYVIGEHGDSQCIAWSSAHVGGVPLLQFPEFSQQKEREKVRQLVRFKAYDIIACKGFTSFGIASCIATYCRTIVSDSKRVIPVSCYIERFGVCLSMPAVIGAQGVEKILSLPLSEQEEQHLVQSVNVLQAMYHDIKKT